MPKYLITSALPYINGIKHLGNLAGSLLPADVYARFLRQDGEEVLFICATDEHGTPAELSALKENLEIKDYCFQMHHKQANIYEQFNLSFDYFGRSSSQQNHGLTKEIFLDLDKNGFIEEKEIKQVYSLTDQRFLPDRYVEGICPKCGYEAARGDQCEYCTSVLDPTELINPRSAVSKSTDLEIKSTKHLFLRLDKLSDDIKDWVLSHGHWPRLTTSIAMKWINEGLQSRCITRDLKWGISIPKEGFEEKVFYVWFDAPIEYIGATKEWADANPSERNWESWWVDANDVVYTQFMAKDNVPFHAVFFPGMLLGTKRPWTQATNIKSFNWLTYYGGKFSTSQKRGVFMDQALEILPADYWRYFLIAHSPESDDSSFTWETFASVVNKDLVGTFGNIVNRTLKLTASKFGKALPEGGGLGFREKELHETCKQIMIQYRDALRNQEFRKAISYLRELWSQGNLYLDERVPWSLLHQDREEAAMVLRTTINLIRIFAIAASPIIPQTTEKVFQSLNLERKDYNMAFVDAVDLEYMKENHPFEVPDLLFKRIEEEDLNAYKAKFAGDEA
ncbi:methionine--tRNA ligase [Hazenella coriacea]|uniref:Methionine--tRNA ligase n=1 Tax=Hazenella coriacea TaxID=1179467 RepID=A0A4R3L882_9BACL|nr:methionine--tRNA ligase [Hazenella coriacea]TCS95772.1 methionyl-tRNA synthetase [Hazenella coriacea]